MPLALGSYIPGPHFAAPRAYYSGIIFDLPLPYSVAALDNVYIWTKAGSDEQWVVELDNRFWLWTSNRWTLDFMVTRFQLKPDVFSPFSDQPFTLQPVPSFVSKEPMLLFQFNGINFMRYLPFDFPPPPGNYWLPRPL